MKKIFAKIHLWLSLPLGIVLTVVCLSGAVLVFEGEITQALHPELYRVAAPADARPLQPLQLVDRIGEQMPDSLHLVSLQLTAHYTAYKTIVLTQAEAQVTRRSAMRRIDRATFDPRNGRLAEITRYEDTPRQQRLRGWFYTFHTGTWGGIWTKILYFLAALIGATLPLTGYYLWWKRYSNKKNRK